MPPREVERSILIIRFSYNSAWDVSNGAIFRRKASTFSSMSWSTSLLDIRILKLRPDILKISQDPLNFPGNSPVLSLSYQRITTCFWQPYYNIFYINIDFHWVWPLHMSHLISTVTSDNIFVQGNQYAREAYLISYCIFSNC